MPTYSNSKLRAFEQCPLQYKFRYIDRIPTDIESVEAFTGKRVHEALEWLHLEARDREVPALDQTLRIFDERWESAWHRLVHFAKRNVLPDHYHRRGARCTESYYRGNWPFDADRTIAVETEISFALGSDILVRGIVDRVARGRDGGLIIHDYKTTSYMPRRAELLGDLQLAIYQMGAAERWPGEGAISLVWHFLGFARKVTVGLGRAIESRRRELERRILAVERVLERGDEMPSRVSKLCDWCSYRPICPAQGGDPARAPQMLLEPRRARRAGAVAAGGRPPVEAALQAAGTPLFEAGAAADEPTAAAPVAARVAAPAPEPAPAAEPVPAGEPDSPPGQP